MLNEKEIEKYEEETYMMLNPTDRYLLKKGKIDVAKKLFAKGFQIDEIIELTDLTKEDLLKENIS